MGFFSNILEGKDSTASLNKEEAFMGILLAT